MNNIKSFLISFDLISIYISLIFFLLLQAAYDKLTEDNADQKASYDNHMAKAALDAEQQKASFDNQMAKAALDAGDMKVCGLFNANNIKSFFISFD